MQATLYAIIYVTIQGYTAGLTDQTKHASLEACQHHIETVLKPVVQQLAGNVPTTPRCSTRPL